MFCCRHDGSTVTWHWVDDEIGEDAIAWANSRSAPTLLIDPDPRYRLLDEHVDELLAFDS